MKKVIDFLRMFVPYGLLLFLRYLRRYKISIIYEGDYSSWCEAESKAGGYGTSEIIEKVLASSNAVLRGEAVFERDSCLYYKEEYNWAILSCLYRIHSTGVHGLHLLDFGGALGSSYWQNRKYLDVFSEVHWHIVEQKSFLEASSRLVHVAPLTFEKTIGESFTKYPINVVLISSVLQYIENHQSLLEDIVSHEPGFIIIDRTPFFSTGETSQISVESVPEIIYPASYVCEIRPKDSFIQFFLGHGYKLVMQWDSNVDSPITISNRTGQIRTVLFCGFLLQKCKREEAKT